MPAYQDWRLRSNRRAGLGREPGKISNCYILPSTKKRRFPQRLVMLALYDPHRDSPNCFMFPPRS